MTDLIGLGLKALFAKAEIEGTIDIAKPILAAYLKAEPELTPRIRSLSARFFPDMQTEVAKTGVCMIDTTMVQEALNKLGAGLKVDGDYGEVTKAAVRNFQLHNSLVVDGWCGEKTVFKLGAALDKAGLL